MATKIPQKIYLVLGVLTTASFFYIKDFSQDSELKEWKQVETTIKSSVDYNDQNSTPQLDAYKGSQDLEGSNVEIHNGEINTLKNQSLPDIHDLSSILSYENKEHNYMIPSDIDWSDEVIIMNAIESFGSSQLEYHEVQHIFSLFDKDALAKSISSLYAKGDVHAQEQLKDLIIYNNLLLSPHLEEFVSDGFNPSNSRQKLGEHLEFIDRFGNTDENHWIGEKIEPLTKHSDDTIRASAISLSVGWLPKFKSTSLIYEALYDESKHVNFAALNAIEIGDLNSEELKSAVLNFYYSHKNDTDLAESSKIILSEFFDVEVM